MSLEYTENFYLNWRRQRFVAPALNEADPAPPEKLLQQIWLYQRILREELATADGQRLRVLHPGFWNHSAGPDFKEAILQFDNKPPISGDIEIDLVPQGWDYHSHANNPAYAKVILHIIWDAPNAGSSLPTLSLKKFLDAPLPELSFWLGGESLPYPEGLAGQCSGPLRLLNQNDVTAILRQAAHARLQRKAEAFQARARQVGWTQTLWEGLFSALGYKGNTWPMRRLGELTSLVCADLPSENKPAVVQSRLLGLSGLLPTELPNTTSTKQTRNIWDIWWRERDKLSDHILPKSIWRLHGIRPPNRPERRLALAGIWLTGSDIPQKLEEWLTRKIDSSDLLQSLQFILQPPLDPFWSFHSTLSSAPLKSPQPLLGEQRITDLAINIILPWLWVRALAGKSKNLKDAAEKRYFAWPAAEDNSILKLARQRLFAGAKSSSFKTAAEQQGLLQIVRDFCDHSNALCQHCQFPDLLRAFQNSMCHQLNEEPVSSANSTSPLLP